MITGEAIKGLLNLIGSQVSYEHRLAASVQSDRRRNFGVSNKGAFRRSNLILFVLVFVLVLVLGNQNFIEDEGRVRGRGPYFATTCGSS